MDVNSTTFFVQSLICFWPNIKLYIEAQMWTNTFVGFCLPYPSVSIQTVCVVQIIGDVSVKMSDSAALTSAELGADCLKSAAQPAEERRSSLFTCRRLQPSLSERDTLVYVSLWCVKRKKKTLLPFSQLSSLFLHPAVKNELADAEKWCSKWCSNVLIFSV